MKLAEEIIDEAYNRLFDNLCKISDDFCELKIEYQEISTGKTIIRSWKDREERTA
jgi:hypothetical protein